MLNHDLQSQDIRRQHELDSLRRRMLSDLENFLSKALNRPFPRLAVKPQPASPPLSQVPRPYTLLSLN
jgi:hypothetical protein